MIKKYTNGWTAWYIDEHPYGKLYRDIRNNLGYVAFPEETIMVLQKSGTVVVFLETIDELSETEKQHKLITI